MNFLQSLLLLFAPFLLVGATLYGTNKTKARLGTSAGSNILAMGLYGGKVRCMVDTYTILGTESDGDTIEMGDRLPRGAHVLEQTLSCNASVAATITVICALTCFPPMTNFEQNISELTLGSGLTEETHGGLFQ